MAALMAFIIRPLAPLSHHEMECRILESVLRREYVGTMSVLRRGYVGAMSGFGLPYVGSESKPRRRDMPQKGPPRPSLAN